MVIDCQPISSIMPTDDTHQLALCDELVIRMQCICTHLQIYVLGIVGSIQGLNRDPRSPDFVEHVLDCIETIDSCSCQLMAQVNDILDLSKSEAKMLTLKIVPFSLVESMRTLERTFRSAAASKGLGFEVSIKSVLVAPYIPSIIPPIIIFRGTLGETPPRSATSGHGRPCATAANLV